LEKYNSSRKGENKGERVKVKREKGMAFMPHKLAPYSRMNKRQEKEREKGKREPG